ncbi:GNAT family N-acetyltransferase [Phanerochaete sordida]|uniref:GNAT family N-acetyltransferase n=1 Tax=Phanerochaete sordida TaxID=48140 RepID=A0A9P3GRW9_9APHY|nr:GNAT family N-acetyltransferase [Phanerochaete sordida]
MAAAYDPNFHFAVKELESERVKLVPYHPEMNGRAFYEASLPYPEIYKWVPFGPFSASDSFLEYIERRIRRDPAITLYVVYNKSQESGDEIAGAIGLLNTDPTNLCTEIGFVFTLPPFQRSHVTTNAVGLLLAWCLDDLKLRRVQWQANARNEKSIAAAQKLGFTFEGVVRWQRILPPEKHETGAKPREDDPKPEYYGRNTALLSICWDEWESGVKEKVFQRMNRK